jgi:hypothetical protein
VFITELAKPSTELRDFLAARSCAFLFASICACVPLITLGSQVFTSGVAGATGVVLYFAKGFSLGAGVLGVVFAFGVVGVAVVLYLAKGFVSCEPLVLSAKITCP